VPIKGALRQASQRVCAQPFRIRNVPDAAGTYTRTGSHRPLAARLDLPDIHAGVSHQKLVTLEATTHVALIWGKDCHLLEIRTHVGRALFVFHLCVISAGLLYVCNSAPGTYIRLLA